MSTTENEEMEDESTVIDDSTEEETETSSNEEDITYEQARAWKQSLDKANKKIAHLSKEKKAIEKPTDNESAALDDDSLDELLERRDFYKKNAEAKALKDDIEQLYKTSKGKFSREDIYGKLSGDSEIEENRKVYAKSSVTGKQSSSDSFVAIDIDKYDSMSPTQQKAYNSASIAKKGGVIFKD